MTKRECGEVVLSRLDRELERLRAGNPGWRIWYVPHSGTDGITVTWCAQPHPLLNCHSVQALTEEIGRASASVPTRNWRPGD